MSFRHVILDRDGVLNYEAPEGSYVREPSEFRWLPGALEGLALLRRAGLRLSVATNQAGVGRGVMSLAQLAAVHERMQAEAAAHGGTIDAVLYCPHAPEERCSCRKPAPGLIEAAVAGSGIAASDTIVVGDDLRDLEAAERAGIAATLVRTGKGRRTEAMLGNAAVPAYDNLRELARAVLAARPDSGGGRERE